MQRAYFTKPSWTSAFSSGLGASPPPWKYLRHFSAAARFLGFSAFCRGPPPTFTRPLDPFWGSGKSMPSPRMQRANLRAPSSALSRDEAVGLLVSPPQPTRVSAASAVGRMSVSLFMAGMKPGRPESLLRAA